MRVYQYEEWIDENPDPVFYYSQRVQKIHVINQCESGSGTVEMYCSDLIGNSLIKVLALLHQTGFLDIAAADSWNAIITGQHMMKRRGANDWSTWAYGVNVLVNPHALGREGYEHIERCYVTAFENAGFHWCKDSSNDILARYTFSAVKGGL